MTAPVPAAAGALDAVRDLERSLDVRERSAGLAERRLAEARGRADAILADARERAERAARKARDAALGAADRDAAATLAAAEHEQAALRDRLASLRPGLLEGMRAAVLGPGAARGGG